MLITIFFLSQAACIITSIIIQAKLLFYCCFSTLLLRNLKCTEPVNIFNVLHTLMFTWHFKTVYINEN